MNIYIFGLTVMILVLKPFNISSCSLPLTWDGTWYDSTEGTITFSRGTNQVISGWTVSLGPSSVTSWTCVAENVSNRHILFRGDSSLSYFSSTIIPYLCVAWNNVTDYSFYYYILADYQSNGVNERVYLEQYNPAITTWSTTTYCNPINPPRSQEFIMAIKQGFQSSAKIEYPSELLGTFTYTYNAGGSTYCSANSYLDICSDKTTANFNYSLCSSKQLFSDEGRLHCVASIASGTTKFVSIYNPGVIDNVNYFRFTCMAVDSSGSSTTASVSSGSCEPSQTPSAATSTGGILSISRIANCTHATSTVTVVSTVMVVSTVTFVSSSNTMNNTFLVTNTTTTANDWFCATLDMTTCYGILAGVCVLGIVSFVAVAFVFCIYLCKKKKEMRKLDRLPTQLTPRNMREPSSLPASTHLRI